MVEKEVNCCLISNHCIDGTVIMHLENLVFLSENYPTSTNYPFHLPVFRKTERIDLSSPVTFFIGENGSGKSTLLEAISRKCNIHLWRSDEGRRYDNNPYEKALHRFIEITWQNGHVPGSYFSSETHRDFTRFLDNWAAADPGQLKYFGGKSLMTQSHGQSLMSLFENRYKIKGLYLSDEPDTALSPRSQIRLVKLIRNMSLAGHAQFIIVTHSPIILACPGAVIYSFDHIPIQRIEYEDTEYYRVYKRFMEDRIKCLEDC